MSRPRGYCFMFLYPQESLLPLYDYGYRGETFAGSGHLFITSKTRWLSLSSTHRPMVTTYPCLITSAPVLYPDTMNRRAATLVSVSVDSGEIRSLNRFLCKRLYRDNRWEWSRWGEFTPIWGDDTCTEPYLFIPHCNVHPVYFWEVKERMIYYNV